MAAAAGRQAGDVRADSSGPTSEIISRKKKESAGVTVRQGHRHSSLRSLSPWTGREEGGGRGGEGRGLSLLHQSVDVMLGAVLAVGHLKHARHAQQRLLGVPVRHHLQQDGETSRRRRRKSLQGHRVKHVQRIFKQQPQPWKILGPGPVLLTGRPRDPSGGPAREAARPTHTHTQLSDTIILLFF